MGVYVDELLGCMRNKNWPCDESCHLLADSIGELHGFAENLGLKRSWFQKGSLPHYDLTSGMRARAVRAGAVEIDRKEFIELFRKYRKIRCR